MAFRTYSPERVKVVIAQGAGYNVVGFAEGTFIEASRNSENTTTSAGAAGDIGITKIADKSGTLTMTLMQTSPSNQVLSAIQNAQDMADDILRFDIGVMDPSGGFLMVCKSCHLQIPASVSLSSDQEDKEWTFFVEELLYSDVPVGTTNSSNVQADINNAIQAIEDNNAKILAEIG